jgi:hypothetical protein
MFLQVIYNLVFGAKNTQIINSRLIFILSLCDRGSMDHMNPWIFAESIDS